MRLIKESKIKRGVINPGNYMRTRGYRYYLFVNVHGLCFQSGLAPQRHHLAGTNRQRHILGARMADVAKWQRKCKRGDPEAFPRLCHHHQSHGAGVCSLRNGHRENLMPSRGFLKINVRQRWMLRYLWEDRALNIAREAKKEGDTDGERINSAISVMNVCKRPER